MSTPLVLLTCALLFAAFGLVMRRQRRAPGCDACSSACHRTADSGSATGRNLASGEGPTARGHKESHHA